MSNPASSSNPLSAKQLNASEGKSNQHTSHVSSSPQQQQTQPQTQPQEQQPSPESSSTTPREQDNRLQLPPHLNTNVHKSSHPLTTSPTSTQQQHEQLLPQQQHDDLPQDTQPKPQQQPQDSHHEPQQDPLTHQAAVDAHLMPPPPPSSTTCHHQRFGLHHQHHHHESMSTNTPKFISTQIHLKEKPKSKDQVLDNISTQQVILPPLEEGDIIIKVLYIAMDASFRTLVCHECDRYCPPPFCGPSHSSKSSTTTSTTSTTQQTSREQQHVSKSEAESGRFSHGGEDKKCQLNHGVLKGYAVGEIVESRNRIFTKGRNVYGNLGIQKYLYATGGCDLDDNLVRDITMNSSLASFLTLSKAGLCAYFGVTELSNVTEGDSVMVTGGSGCVGALIPQIVRAFLMDQHVKQLQKEQEEKAQKSLAKTKSSSSKAKSPTLSWCVNALVGADHTQSPHPSSSTYGSYYQQQPPYRYESPSSSLSTPEDEKEETKVSPSSQHTTSRLFPHPSAPAIFSMYPTSPPPVMMVTKPPLTPSSQVPQVKICGLCSSEKKVQIMKQNFKYDECIDYSQYLKKPIPFDVTPSGSFCAGGSCFEPAWASNPSSSSTIAVQPPSPSTASYLTDVYKRLSDQMDREALSEAIRAKCPNGIDVLIDTVGGVMLDVCLEHINHNARVVLCGAISQQNASKIEGPFNYVNLILKSARMEGFVLDKFKSKFKEASQTLVRWIQEKKLNGMEENVVECNLDQKEDVARAFGLLFSDEYTGKLILRVRH
ncbi:hypothetical protein FDP41_008568 [Naegleria fowleri]|uniref:Alcohol dehydrogenase-like C-terminal domain-containing protein n=1 Tax=Naegleria fowleri TaxID=5763 RepID=A0A6A5BFV1_NAEFO|nr:uncharacterized protein FDP41_008568 [Naegleria fowleri]KAF0973361.1 hypothetical protein FDP41_008568 [Naegleria fowleri]